MKRVTAKGGIFLLLLWVQTLLCTVCAQSVIIKGTVQDENHQPVEIANIHIEGTLVGATSDLKGRYRLRAESGDSMVVVCSMIGYQTRKKVLHNPKDSVTVNFLLPSDAGLIGEVTVTEMHRQLDGMAKLDAKQTKHTPSVSGNAVEEMIATQAGVSTHNELSSQYNVRGGSFDENCVYINGVEVFRPLLIRSGQQEGLSVINSNMVDNISFSAGGYSAQYGDKMSSVLDITYKRPEAHSFEGTAYGSLLGGGIYVGAGLGKLSMTHGLRYKTNQYLLGTLETKGEYDPQFIDYQTYISWRPNKRWDIDFIGNISENKYNFTPSDRETRFGTMNDVKSFKVYFDGQEKDLFRTFFGSLQLKHHLTDHTTLTLASSVFNTKEQETFDLQGQYWLNDTHTEESLGVGTYMQHARNFLTANTQALRLLLDHKTKAHTIKAGLGWRNEHIKDNSREWEMRDSAGYSLPHNDDYIALVYSMRSNNEIKSNRWELFAEDNYRFQNSLGLMRVNYGVRASHWDWNGEWLISPRASIGLVPAFDENFTFRLATGVYYQSPFYKEIKDTITTNGNTIAQLNSNIKSQRSIHFVMAGDYKFRMRERPFKFTTELYYKKQNNLIPYNIDNMRIVYYGTNNADGYVTGIDMKLYGEFVEGTDSWLSVSLMKAEEKINGKWVPQPTDQRYNVSLFFSDYFTNTKKWRMNLKLTYADGLPFGTPHGGLEAKAFKAPAYRRVDIGMNYRLLDNEDRRERTGWKRYFKNVWLGVDCFNLLGTSNVNSYYWITDVTNQQYAVPNYLTGRQLNLRFLAEF